MTLVSQGHCKAPGRKFCLQGGLIFLAAFLMSLISVETRAQEETDICPCFSFEEVESIFLMGSQVTEEGGARSCRTEDFSVECNAEVTLWDKDFAMIAQARVDWFDFDPSRCEYMDIAGNPGVERNISWPHPAPEAAARACYRIIARVIEKLDTSGECETYP